VNPRRLKKHPTVGALYAGSISAWKVQWLTSVMCSHLASRISCHWFTAKIWDPLGVLLFSFFGTEFFSASYQTPSAWGSCVCVCVCVCVRACMCTCMPGAQGPFPRWSIVKAQPAGTLLVSCLRPASGGKGVQVSH
jgi:hypothetical protein